MPANDSRQGCSSDQGAPGTSRARQSEFVQMDVGLRAVPKPSCYTRAPCGSTSFTHHDFGIAVERVDVKRASDPGP